jgi:surface antigen
MKMKTLLLGALAVALFAGPASAQRYERNSGDGDQNGAYDRSPSGPTSAQRYERNSGSGDQNGAHDRNLSPQSNPGPNDQRGDNRGYFNRRNDNNGNYYRQGAYEQNCRSGNQAAGTIFGALAGGLIGSAATRGNGGAVVGGAVLGGLLGNTISRDISCDNQPYAFRTYSSGLNGEVGRRYSWDHGGERGYFVPTREFRRAGTVCRDFTETTYTNGHSFQRSGTSCRAQDGNWRFD